MSWDNCYIAIGDPVCPSDATIPGGGTLDALDNNTTFDDGNMVWTQATVAGVVYWVHPYVDRSTLTVGQSISFFETAVPRQSLMGIARLQ